MGDLSSAHKQRLQQLREDAYKLVLKAFHATQQSGLEKQILQSELARELNISMDFQKAILDALQKGVDVMVVPDSREGTPQDGSPLAYAGGASAAKPNTGAGSVAAGAAGGWASGSGAQATSQPPRSVPPADGGPMAVGGSGGPGGAPGALAASGAGSSGGAPAGVSGAPAKKRKISGGEVGDIAPYFGRKVRRWWPSYNRWYDGVVTDYREEDDKYEITYQMGQKDKEEFEWYNLNAATPQECEILQETVKLSEMRKSKAFETSRIIAMLTQAKDSKKHAA